MKMVNDSREIKPGVIEEFLCRKLANMLYPYIKNIMKMEKEEAELREEFCKKQKKDEICGTSTASYEELQHRLNSLKKTYKN